MALPVERPVFVDLETRSRVDLKVAGPWNYAEDCALLTASWSAEPGVYHVWMPSADHVPDEYRALHLDGLVVHTGWDIPGDLLDVCDRPWVAHNAWGFDEIVWSRLAPGYAQPVDWIDTDPLARAAGLPGGLEAIGVRLWGEGKYEDGHKVTMKYARGTEDPPVGPLCLIARYNVQDVRLLEWLWDELRETLYLPPEEWEVLAAHREINARGVVIDTDLLRRVRELSQAAVGHVVERIAVLTGGFLSSDVDLRSPTKVKKWIARIGVDWGDSLRREIVDRWVKEFGTDEEDDHEGQGTEDGEVRSVSNLALAAEVLTLRQSALRVTEGKLKAANGALCSDGRLRGLLVYWGAHPGRFAGRRLQVQNLPKAKDTVDVWDALDALTTADGHESLLARIDGSLDRAHAKALKKDPQAKRSTYDDVASGLIRGVIVGEPWLMAADLAQIEWRVLAWMAGQQWMLDAAWKDEDPYAILCVKLFGAPPPHKKHPWRNISKIIELGSGYRLGVDRMAVYGIAAGIDWEKVGTNPQKAVEAYRDTHPAVAGLCAGEYKGRKYYRGGLWEQMENAAIETVRTGEDHFAGRCRFERFKDHLLLHLPSARRLVYRHARVVKAPLFGKMRDQLQYVSPRYGRTTTHGGILTQNADEGISRDVLVAGHVRMRADGRMPVVMHVHDETVCATTDEGLFPAFMSHMTTTPPWLVDFPLDAEGGLLPRYAKSPPPGINEEVWRNGRKHK